MLEETRARISAFLAQYVQMQEGDYLIPKSDADFVSAIELLISQEVFTKDELSHECAKDYAVIIPEYLFGRFAKDA